MYNCIAIAIDAKYSKMRKGQLIDWNEEDIGKQMQREPQHLFCSITKIPNTALLD